MSNNTCSFCKGEGRVPGKYFGTNPCPECKGHGFVGVIRSAPVSVAARSIIDTGESLDFTSAKDVKLQ